MQTCNISLIIVGSGPAGCTAALYATRAGIPTLRLVGSNPGGQLMQTIEVENWPGGDAYLTGPKLMDDMEAQLSRLNIEKRYETAKNLEKSGNRLTLVTDQATYQAEAVIIATGATANYLGLESERALLGNGVSACATCDGFLYRNKPVAVVGGGNTALEEALYLSKLASKVHLIHRRETFRAEKILQERFNHVVKSGKIERHLSKRIHEVTGSATEGVTGVSLRETHDDSQTDWLPVKALFVAIGHRPATDWVANRLDRDQHGYLTLKPHPLYRTLTSCDGVFAAGDVADNRYRQAITAAGAGCMAALDVKNYLEMQAYQSTTLLKAEMTVA